MFYGLSPLSLSLLDYVLGMSRFLSLAQVSQSSSLSRTYWSPYGCVPPVFLILPVRKGISLDVGCLFGLC